MGRYKQSGMGFDSASFGMITPKLLADRLWIWMIGS
jgi:hypothetical protein